MKKIIISIIGMLLGIDLYATHSDCFGYGSIGMIGGYPALGGGYRSQHGCHGVDVSGKIVPWKSIPAAAVRGCYLLYPKQNGLYLGTGVGFVREGETLPRGSISFDLIFGYQWKTARDSHRLALDSDYTQVI